MNMMDLLIIISRWIHIGAAIVVIGGSAFFLIALLPSAEEVLDAEEHQRLREAVRVRWARIVHACIALLLVTGGANLVFLVILPKVEPMPYHAIFAVKFLAAMGIFFLGSVLVGRSPAFARMRQDTRKWLGVLLVLAALIVLLSGALTQIRTRGVMTTRAVTPASGP